MTYRDLHEIAAEGRLIEGDRRQRHAELSQEYLGAGGTLAGYIKATELECTERTLIRWREVHGKSRVNVKHGAANNDKMSLLVEDSSLQRATNRLVDRTMEAHEVQQAGEIESLATLRLVEPDAPHELDWEPGAPAQRHHWDANMDYNNAGSRSGD